jgi:hypothetical protein
LIAISRAAPASLAGVPKVFLLEGGESAAKGIRNECAVASIMCDDPILPFEEFAMAPFAYGQYRPHIPAASQPK